MILLAGDIGGTNARLAFYQDTEDGLRELAFRVFPTARYANLESVIAQFINETGLRPEACCLGVAGPVLNGRAQITNLPWNVEVDGLSAVCGAQQSFLLNDLEAVAYGVFALKEADFATLQPGIPSMGNACVIAAGTGLGEAGLVWTGKRHLPIACEGGHASFAPTNGLEMELWQFLHERFGHVSWERVVSGMGLVNIYSFTRQRFPEGEPEWLRERLATAEAAGAISQAGLERVCKAAEVALELFVSLYAAEAGNLALKMMARGGVYIAGGIAPKILPQMQTPRFIESYVNKGRMGELLKAFPVKVILNERVSLMGAAWFAAFGRTGRTPQLR